MLICKSNAEKYKCILTDPINKVVLDILPERYGHLLTRYFKNIPQKELNPEFRKYFKRSKSLLIKRDDKLKDEQKQQVDVMLYYSANISRAYWYKEEFLKIINAQRTEIGSNCIGKMGEKCTALRNIAV